MIPPPATSPTSVHQLWTSLSPRQAHSPHFEFELTEHPRPPILHLSDLPSIWTLFSIPQLSISRNSTYAVLSGYSGGGNLRLAVLDLALSEPSAWDRDTHLCSARYLLRDALARGPSLTMLKLAWHPDSDAHLAILTSDARFRMVDVSTNPDLCETDLQLNRGGSMPPRTPGVIGLGFLEEEEAEEDAPLSDALRGRVRPGARVTSFAFAPRAPGWTRMSVFFLTDAGEVHVACPVAPTPVREAYADAQSPDGAGWGGLESEEEFGPVLPSSVDWHRTPELQGPLPRANASPLAASAALRPYTDLAVLHPSPECVVVAVASAAGHVLTHVLAGGLAPSWHAHGSNHGNNGDASSTAGTAADAAWSFQTPVKAQEGFKISRNPFFGAATPATPDLFGKGRSDQGAASVGMHSLVAYERRSAATMSTSPAPPPPLPTLVTIDVIPTFEFRAAAGEASGPGVDEERYPVTLLAAPGLPETLCVVHRHGVLGIRLAWAYLVASFLRGAADSEPEAAGRLLKNLPEPAVAELVAASDVVIGSALYRGNYGSAAVVTIEASGKSYRASADIRPSAGGSAGMSAAAAGLAASSGRRAPDSAALEALRSLGREAQAEYDRVMADYSSILDGPAKLPEPTVSHGDHPKGPEYEQYLKEWSIHLKKRYATFLEGARLIIEERTAEVARAAADDAQRAAQLADRLALAQRKRQALQLRIETAVKLQCKLGEHMKVLRELLDKLPRPLSAEERAFMMEVTSAFLDQKISAHVTSVVHRATDLHRKYSEERAREARVGRVLGGADPSAVPLPRTEMLRSLRQSELLLSQADGALRRIEGAAREALEGPGTPGRDGYEGGDRGGGSAARGGGGMVRPSSGRLDAFLSGTE